MGPTTGAQAIVLAVLFLGGGAAGALLPAWLAPGSFPAQAVGFFSFVVPFVAGMQAWLGLAIGLAIWGRVRGAWRGARADTPADTRIPACCTASPAGWPHARDTVPSAWSNLRATGRA